MSKNIICSSESSSNEFLLENSSEYNEKTAGNVKKKILLEEVMDSSCIINTRERDSKITVTESALHLTSKFNLLSNNNYDNVERADEFLNKKPPYVNTTDQMQTPSYQSISKSFLAENNTANPYSESLLPFSSAHISYKPPLEVKTLVGYSVPSPDYNAEKNLIKRGDNTTVSKGNEQNSKENIFSPQRDEMVIACSETSLREANNGIYYYEDKEIHHIDDEISNVRRQSFFSSPNQLKSISFDEDALIREFELQSLEDRMSVSECISGTNEYRVEDNSIQLISILTNGDRGVAESKVIFNYPATETDLFPIKCPEVSSNITSLTGDNSCKETTLFSKSTDVTEAPRIINDDMVTADNMKSEGDRLSTDSKNGNINENVLLKEEEDQQKILSHAYSDPALTLSDTIICESLRKVKSSEKQYKLQFPAPQDLIAPLVSPEEIQSASSSHSGSEITPSSEHKIMTNGMVNVELEKSSGGFLHMETDISSSQLTFTEADISSRALKVSDQDFSSCSLPYTEADISSFEFPCTEQDIESSVMYTDADTSSYGLPFNEAEKISSGRPQRDVDTNNSSKLHKEIDTSSYGISSNEFDASSSVFDSSSSGLPYIECESTNRLSFRTVQSCSSGHDVDSLSAGSSGIVREEKSAPEPEPLLQPPVSTSEAPCKDQLKCFPF